METNIPYKSKSRKKNKIIKIWSYIHNLKWVQNDINEICSFCFFQPKWYAANQNTCCTYVIVTWYVYVLEITTQVENLILWKDKITFAVIR